MASSQGSQTQLAMDTALPFDGSSEAYEFLSENLQKVQEHVNTGGLRGTRSHQAERIRPGNERIGGPIVMNPTPEELDNLFPRILGAVESSSDNFQLAETIPAFEIMIDRVAKVFTYSTCVVSRAVFSATQGQPLNLSLEIEAGSEAVSAAGGFPAITPSNTAPYIIGDGVLTIGGIGYTFSQVTLTIDNVVDADRFLNSTTRLEIPATDRIITLSATLPYTSTEVGLYDLAIGGLGASLAWTNGGYSTTFTFPRLQIPAESPVVGGKGEIPLVINTVARQEGTNNELEVQHDAVP